MELSAARSDCPLFCARCGVAVGQVRPVKSEGCLTPGARCSPVGCEHSPVCCGCSPVGCGLGEEPLATGGQDKGDGTSGSGK